MRVGLDAERPYPSINPTRRQCSKSAHGRLCEVAFMSESILLVDDVPVQRRLLDNMVRKFGYESLVAERGDASLTIITSDGASRLVPYAVDIVRPHCSGNRL